MLKLCGCQESCFSQDRKYGHCEFVMCQHLIEAENHDNLCELTNEVVSFYSSEEEYLKLIDKMRC